MHRLSLAVLLFIFSVKTSGQSIPSFADSIRTSSRIPELAYAVLSADSILEMQCSGVRRVGTTLKANLQDKFRIGSNTKTVTSYIAACLVKQGKIRWDTKFFNLYPELKSKSKPAYHDLTLKDLLTFRAPLISWTYTSPAPAEKEIKGDPGQQRYNFIAWILKQEPVMEKRTYYWSNPGYVMAGLMIEKATGKTFEQLVEELGKEHGIAFGFGQPNYKDKDQPWGHNENLEPEPPSPNARLSWLSPAGNVHVSLPGYCKFIQLQLQGLAGRSKIFTAEEFSDLHYGLPGFAFGWRWYTDAETRRTYSHHEGNPGTFLTRVFICKDTGMAFILFANVQSAEAERGMTALLEELRRRYGS